MNRRTIYRKAQFEIEERKAKAEFELDARLKKLYEREPRIKEISDTLTKSMFTLLQQMVDNTDLNAPTHEDLLAERRELLEKHGLDESYLSPDYHCKICKDTGYVGPDTCSCLDQVLIDMFYKTANLEHQFETENFDTFDLSLYSNQVDERRGISPRENMEVVLEEAHKFIENFENKEDNLLLYGETGLGKTFLCNAIAKELLDRGKVVFYVTSNDLFRSIEKARFNRDEEEVFEDLTDMALSSDLLIIDDLGTEFSTSVTKSAFFGILNDRLIYRKPTVISTNLSLQDIQKEYSDRVLSRIVGSYTHLQFFGEDIRMKKKYS